MNLPNLIDLSPILNILAALAGSGYSTSGALQFLRELLLDRLTQAMPDAQRNAILRAVLFAMNYALIGGLALLSHYALSWNLAGAVLMAALVTTGGASFLYNYNQKAKPSSYQEIPVGQGSDVNNASNAG